MQNPFQPHYEKEIAESFPSYTKLQLKDFITHALSIQIMLTLSLEPKDPKNDAREKMLEVVKRLQNQAIDELNKRVAISRWLKEEVK